MLRNTESTALIAELEWAVMIKMEDKSYHELINECSRDLCLDSHKCTVDCHARNCENSWHAEKLIKAGWIKQKIGTWKLHSNGSGTCSECHFTQLNVWDYDSQQRYCGCCGAKMKGCTVE